MKNASIIAPKAKMVRLKAAKKEVLPEKVKYWPNHNGTNSWMKTEIVDITMAMLFEIRNALKATFVLRIAKPVGLCGA